MKEKDKENGYDESVIDDIIALIKGEDGKEIDMEDFNKIQREVKDFHWYDRDDIAFDEVMEYCNWGIDSHEREELLDELGVTRYDIPDDDKFLGDLEVKTLDDEFRMELLLKMYKSTCSLTELESLIKPSHIYKLNNVVL